MLLSVIDPAVGNPAADRTTQYAYDIMGNGTQVTDAEGRKTTYSWDAHRQLVDALTDKVLNAADQLVAYHQTFVYDGEGNLVTSTDRNGNVTQYLYTTNGLIRRTTDPIGNVTEYLYNADLKQIQITIGAQLAVGLRRILKYSFDNEDQLITETDALNGVTTYAYDAPGNIVTVTDANGHTTDFEFDKNNRMVKEIQPQVTVNGQPVRYTIIHQYDESGNEIATTDENGHKTTFAYDRDNRQVMITDANGVTTAFSYDSRDNRTSIAIGVTAHIDANKHVVIDGAPDAQVTTFVYDEFSQLIARTDGVGNALVTSDNALYQQMRTKMGFSALVGGLSGADKTAILAKFTDKYTYDRVGNVLTITDHKGRVTKTTYDALSRIQSQTEAFGTTEQRTTSYRYDGNDNRVKATDGLNRVSTSKYDANDRLTDSTSALGVVTHSTYDNVGNQVSQTRAFGTSDARTTTWVYDLNNRQTGMTDPESHTTTYVYDAVGNRTKVIDGRGGTATYDYDALDRNVRILDPVNAETKFEYDGVGNRVTIVDAKGGITRLTYDPGNRYFQTTDAEGRITKFTYDVLGNVVTQTTALNLAEAQTTTFVYDAEGHLRKVTDAGGKSSSNDFDELYNTISTTDGNGHTTTYGFDALNRTIQVTDAAGGVTKYKLDLEGNTLEETDAKGRVRKFDYDDGNRLMTETDALGIKTTYTYDKVDNQITITRAANTTQAATTTFVYDKDDRLVEKKDALGGSTKYEYDANDNVTKVTDANGHATLYSYDAADQVKTITDARNFVTQYKYDANGNRTQVIDGRGGTTTTYYNKDNEVVLTIDGVGAATALSYDGNGNVVQRVDFMTLVTLPVDPAAQPAPASSAADRTTTYEYDKLNRLKKQTDATGGFSTATYDAVGNKLTETDENGHTKTYTYDELDRVKTVKDARGNTHSYSYDAVSNQITETDELGRTYTSSYDDENRVLSITDPLGFVRSFTYDAVGNTLTSTDANGHVATFTYDALDRLKTEKDPLGKTRTYVYDAVGNTKSVSDENNHTTTFDYDFANNLLSSTNALGKTRSFTYDAVGNVKTVTDENGHATTFVYDNDDQLKSQTDAKGGVHSYTYDAVGNALTETSELSKTTTYVYDKLNRLTKETDPLGFFSTYGYDAVGNKTSETDQNGFTTTWTYDELDRLTSQTDPLGGVRSYTYDAVGNKLTETDENGHKIVFKFDDDNRLVAQISAEGYLTTFEYDKVGNKTAAHAYRNKYTLGANDAVPSPAAGDLPRDMTYTYDDDDRLKTEKDPVGTITTYEYDDVGNQTAVTVGSNTSAPRRSTTTYDAANRVTDTTDVLGIVTHYVLDGVGNVTDRYDNWNATTQTGERHTQFEYDELDRLTKQTDALNFVTTFGYDAVGQLKTRTSAVGKPEQRVETFEYDDDGRLTAQVNGESERTEFKYDKVGNRTQITVAPGLAEERTNKFEYDKVNRLSAEVDGTGVRTEYKYDAVGNKTEIIQAVGLGVQERHTLLTYSVDDRLLSIVDPIGYARAHSGATEFVNWRTAHGFSGSVASLSTADIASIQATQRTSYEYDDMGNQTRITDADGTVTNNTFDDGGRLVTNVVGANAANGGVKTTNSYDAFGNVLTSKQEFATGANTDGRTMTYEYDKLDRQTRVTDGEGFSTDYKYDAFGNLKQVTRGVFTAGDPLTHIYDNKFEYDALNRLTASEDGNHNRVESTYDGLGNRLTQTAGIVGTGGADVAHASKITFVYDKAGRLIEKDSATGGVVKITYDEAGNQTKLETLQSGDPASASAKWVTESFTYDGNGRVHTSKDSYDTVTVHNFDSVGNETSTVFAQGTTDERTIKFEYNLDNDRTASIDALDNRTAFAYDAVGNLVKQTDALGRVTRFYYDAFHRVIGQIDARNFVTTFKRDAAGNITETKLYATALAGTVQDSDPLSTPTASSSDRTITSTFDRANRIKTQVSPDGSSRAYTYDSGGKLLTQTDNGAPSLMSRTWNQAARVLKWSYDDGGRLIRFDNTDGTYETYGYDAANNKTSESLTNPNTLVGGRTDPVRTTTFEYDLDNRLSKQIFDKAGIDAEQILGYDKAGNVISKTNENGAITTSEFDLLNRVTKLTDPTSHSITYGYDLIGNLTSATNGNGFTVKTEFDKDNRAVKEIRPNIDATNIGDDGTPDVTTVAPTSVTKYDAVGNIVQITDARGFTTTRWYDKSNNVLAERNGDGAVRAYTYDAFGSVITVTQDMKFHDEAIDLTTAPTLSSGPDETRTVTNTVDSMGRVTQTQFAQITVTTLSNTGGSSPTATTSQVTPTELNYYDAFGNLVESVDRNGNHTYGYYDVVGRQIAAVDAAGYLTQTDYDDLGHVVQQRKYATKLGSVSAGTLPTAPSGVVATVDRFYDLAGRLVDEISPAVKTASGTQRVVTHFTYDDAGNLLSKTIGYATVLNGVQTLNTTNPRAEYYYYDGNNRRVAVVNPERVLSIFTYDGDGNVKSQQRYFNTVPSAINLATAALGSIVAAVQADTGKDEETDYTYDTADRVLTRTDLMGPGTADDITNVSAYDEVGNLTYRKDPEGYISLNRYDSAGHIVESIAPNGSDSHIVYDTGGQKIRAWTGGTANSEAPAATITGATVANGANTPVVITWNQPGTDVTSWVAWDTVKHNDTDVPSGSPGTAGSYAHASSATSSGNGVSASIAVAGGGTIYFRIMSRDTAGNLAWTEEQSLVVPPRIASIVVGQSGGNSVVTVTLDTAISGGMTLTRASPALSVAMTASNGNKTFTATFTGSKTDNFQLAWTDNGKTYTTTDVQLLQAPGPHVGAANGWVTWLLPNDGTGAVGTGQYMFVNGVLQTDQAYMGAIDGTNVTTTVANRINNTTLNFNPGISGNATVEYDAVYGNLSSATHSGSIGFTQRQFATVAFDHYTTHQDNGNTVYDSTTYKVTWQNEAIKTNVSVTLDSTETSKVGAGGVHVAYRTAQNGIGGFADAGAATKNGNTYSLTLFGSTQLTAGTSYDIKVYYTDSSGKEVIVEYRRVTVPANATVPSQSFITTNGKDNVPATPADISKDLGSQSYTGDLSLQVLAQETNGSITKSGSNLTVTAGNYLGAFNPGTTSLQLDLTKTTNSVGDHKHADGFEDKTYYTEIEYNAMGVKIATNEDTGVWRRFGVDANGNVVETISYGTQKAETDHLAPILTFKQYDERNQETASWGGDAAAGRAVTRTSYDFQGRIVSVTDPGNTSANARTFTYDDVGNVIGSTDAEGNSTSVTYNIFGQLVAQTDANNHTRRKVYDNFGNLVEESVDGSTDHRFYTYDAFDRRTEVRSGATRASSTAYSLAYDQHDRVTSVTDPMSGVTRYYYDKRDYQAWTQDANGNWFGQVTDGSGLTTHKYSFTSTPSSLADAQSKVSSNDASLIDDKTTYDLFGNKISETDPEGRAQYYTYGAFGRLESVSIGGTTIDFFFFKIDVPGLVTSYGYDRFGNRTTETSNYGKNITYSYDNAGHLTKIDDTGTKTATTYGYDVAGRRTSELLQKGSPLATVHSYSYTYNHNGWMLTWKDASTAIGETLTYDKVGNVASVKGEASGNTSLFTHTYTYDNSDRVLTGGGNTYTYDSHGRRGTWNDGTTTVTYTYDNNDRVTAAGSLHWTYDKVGNVTSVYDSTDLVFSTDINGNPTGVSSGRDQNRNYTVYRYDSRNFNYFSESSKFSDDHHDGYQQTTTNVDKSGRTTSLVLMDAGNPGDAKTYTYSYVYNLDGTENSVAVSGTGNASGSSASGYDVNRQLVTLDQGKGDGLDHAEIKTFTYDNAGHIISANHDTGKDADKVNGVYPTNYYLYANDNPAGQYQSADAPTLDTGDYSVVKSVVGSYGDSAPGFPDTTVSTHTVVAGETLQSIASQVYGHPELWYVIADANGLTGSESLQPGMRLSLPNSVQYVGNSNQDHTLYSAGDIIGSKLPNITVPPPPKDTCLIILAIILIVIVAIIAVVVTVVTVGIAAPAAAAALGVTATSAVGIIVGVAVGAAIGAAVAFTASVITQGILIGFKLQDHFDWKQVAADTVAGLFSGAAGGLGAMVEAAQAASVLVKAVNVIGQAALEVAGEVSRQAIANDGHIDNWVGIALAGAGGAFGALASKGIRAEREGEKVASDVLQLSELDKLASKSKLLKTEELAVGDTVFKNTRFKFKAVLEEVGPGQQGPAQLVIKRFERLSAIKQADQFIEASDAGLTDFGKFKGALVGNLEKNPNSTLTAAQRFRAVAKQGLIDQTAGVRSALRSIKSGVTEFFQAGTVGKSALQWTGIARFANAEKGAITKTVKSFTTEVDAVTGVTRRVAQTRRVYRASYLGTSISEQFNQFRKTFSIEGIISSSVKTSDRLKTTRTIEEIQLANGQVRKVIKETQGVIRKSWAKKVLDGSEETLIKYKDTKVIRGFKEVQVSPGVFELRSQIKTVYRQRFLRTAKTDKAADFFGLKTGTVGTPLVKLIYNKAKTATTKEVIEVVEKRLGNGQVQKELVQKTVNRLHPQRLSARAQVYDALADAGRKIGPTIKEAAQDVKDYLKENWDTTAGAVLGKGKAIAAQYQTIGFAYDHRDEILDFVRHPDAAKLQILSDEYSNATSENTIRSAFKFNTGGKFSIVQLLLGANTARGNVNKIVDANKQRVGPYAVNGHPERLLGKTDYFDRQAASNFVDLHERQHGWAPIGWANTAAQATTQIYSPFAIDRAANFDTVLGSNRITAGQTGLFNTRSIVGFAAGTVGRVATNPTPTPIVLLDPNPISPRP